MLPKSERVRKGGEIKETVAARQYVYKGPLLHFVARDNQAEKSRLVVIATKKIGSAVKRNRIRRVLVEAFRREKESLGWPVDMVIYPQAAALAKSLNEVAEDFKNGLRTQQLLGRAKIAK